MLVGRVTETTIVTETEGMMWEVNLMNAEQQLFY